MDHQVTLHINDINTPSFNKQASTAAVSKTTSQSAVKCDQDAPLKTCTPKQEAKPVLYKTSPLSVLKSADQQFENGDDELTADDSFKPAGQDLSFICSYGDCQMAYPQPDELARHVQQEHQHVRLMTVNAS